MTADVLADLIALVDAPPRSEPPVTAAALEEAFGTATAGGLRSLRPGCAARRLPDVPQRSAAWGGRLA